MNNPVKYGIVLKLNEYEILIGQHEGRVQNGRPSKA